VAASPVVVTHIGAQRKRMAGRQSLESRMAAQRWSLQSALSAHEYVCIPRWAGMRLGGRHIPPPQGIRLDKKAGEFAGFFSKR
jgi:hypothetical protein